MSVLISLQGVSKAYIDKVLYEGLNFSVYKGDRLGLIGANGSGKSTLLKLLTGQEEIDEGQIFRHGDFQTAYIEQVESLKPEKSIYETLLTAAERAHVADPHAVVNQTMGKCGFEDGEVLCGDLSGGWRKRLGLACGFVQQAELVLLDEPTNHLDLEGVLWLEQYLKQANFSWIVVSHDRLFLENSTNRIAEVDRIYPNGVYASNGSLGDFLRAKSHFLETEQQRKSSLQNKIKREKEWLSRNPQARGTKSKSRIDRAYDLMDELQAVKNRIRTTKSEIDFTGSHRKTKRLVELRQVSFQFDERVLFKNVEFVLSPGMRIGLLGLNGSGKTTLLKILSGEANPTTGEIKKADKLKIVYFDQYRNALRENDTVKETLCPKGGDAVVFQDREIHVMSWAARFNFSAEQLHSKVKELSGGEQARLLIAVLMLQQADLLLLDEPTNDLDIETLEALEESLLEFSGAVAVVSHDRYFMGRVCNGYLGFHEQTRLSPFASFEQWLLEGSSSPNGNTKRTVSMGVERELDKPSTPRPKATYEERKEYGRIEKSIAKAEAVVQELQEKAYSPEVGSDPEKASHITTELEQARLKVEQLYARWEELDNLIGE